jgi:hypothetical protein
VLRGTIALVRDNKYFTILLQIRDFSIRNSVDRYICASNGVCVIVSNGIPDHDLTLENPNKPCATNWMVLLPLVPSFSETTLDCASLGIIGMSFNGVPPYDAQEGGGTNAVEGGTIVVPYFGHAASTGDWHL